MKAELCGVCGHLHPDPQRCIDERKRAHGAQKAATMIKHADSHLDHNLTEAQIAYVLERFATADRFFTATLELPTELGTVPCDLYGPIMGDDPVDERETYFAKRGSRAWDSRMIRRAPRPTRKVTLIAGPHDGHACVLYTVYGGPLAPQEPWDPGCKDQDASRRFWNQHALADGTEIEVDLDECADCGGSTAEGTPDPHECR